MLTRRGHAVAIGVDFRPGNLHIDLAEATGKVAPGFGYSISAHRFTSLGTFIHRQIVMEHLVRIFAPGDDDAVAFAIQFDRCGCLVESQLFGARLGPLFS